jgi:CBS domain-containing protein
MTDIDGNPVYDIVRIQVAVVIDDKPLTSPDGGFVTEQSEWISFGYRTQGKNTKDTLDVVVSDYKLATAPLMTYIEPGDRVEIKDYMRTSDLPIVTRESKISDVLMQISLAKMGIAVVVEEEQILGAVTDGDIRRAMQRNQEQFFALTVEDIMSRTPKTILETAKLSQAETIMRKHNIHSLVVVNSDGKLVGVIDTFSCI